MGENTRLLYDLINHTEQKEIPGLLLLIDFEKHLIHCHGLLYARL